MYLDVIKKVSEETKECIVGFSGGKDSIVLLDLCHHYFDKIYAYFMYLIPELEFQEVTLKYYEKKYNIKIKRVPHFKISEMLNTGSFRKPSKQSLNIKNTKITDVEKHIKEVFNIEWIAQGLKKADSLSRRPWLEKNKGIDFNKKICYPLANWTDKNIFLYIKKNKLRLPAWYKYSKSSFGCALNFENLSIMKDNFIEDYKKVLNIFPYAEAQIKRNIFHGRN